MKQSALNYDEIKIARDYLQDVAKILGKLQQVFVAPEAHDWHRGLQLTDQGLTTQDFVLDGQTTRALLDMRSGAVSVANQTWELSEYTPQQLFQAVSSWLQLNNPGRPLGKPEFTASRAGFDAQLSEELLTVLSWSNMAFQRLSQSLSNGYASPILLFPHHFDLSYVWFFDRSESQAVDDGRQIGFGFSLGDETIAELYYYVTQYPAQVTFTDMKLPQPGYWQHDDFTGAVMRYNDLVEQPNPEQLLQRFFAAVQQHAASLF